MKFDIILNIKSFYLILSKEKIIKVIFLANKALNT